jgi:Protein of unknown function (DUF669)
MARVVIDSSEAKPQQGFTQYEGPTPPAGLYRVRLSSAKYTKASSGNMMITLVLEFDTTNEKKKQYNGYAVWHRLVQVPQSLWRTNEFLTAIGQPTKLSLDFDEETGKVTKIGGARVGKVYLLAKCRTTEYNGEPRLEVDALTPDPTQVKSDEDIDAEADAEYDADADTTPEYDNPPF